MEQSRFFSFINCFLLIIALQHCFQQAAGEVEMEPVEFGEDDENGGFTKEELQAIRKDALKWHNIFRSWHNSPPMTLDDKLNQDAQDYSLEIVTLPGLKLKHAKGLKVGENLYGSGGRDPKKAGEHSAKAWYGEFCDTKGHPRGKLSHFTQLVWKDSVKLGIGVAKEGSKTIVVARYSAQGNVNAESYKKKNILPLACDESQVCNGLKLKEGGQCGSGKGRSGGGGANAGAKAFVINKERGFMFAVVTILIGLMLDRAAFAV